MRNRNLGYETKSPLKAFWRRLWNNSSDLIIEISSFNLCWSIILIDSTNWSWISFGGIGSNNFLNEPILKCFWMPPTSLPETSFFPGLELIKYVIYLGFTIILFGLTIIRSIQLLFERDSGITAAVPVFPVRTITISDSFNIDFFNWVEWDSLEK